MNAEGNLKGSEPSSNNISMKFVLCMKLDTFDAENLKEFKAERAHKVSNRNQPIPQWSMGRMYREKVNIEWQ